MNEEEAEAAWDFYMAWRRAKPTSANNLDFTAGWQAARDYFAGVDSE